jgi:dihydrolipoamide dehydrogenase
VDGERVMHIYQFIVDKTFPEKIAIVGGGVIGCEMATVLHSYGAEVTIVEAANALLAGREDPRVTQLLQRSLEKQGIKILLGAKVEAAKADGKKAKVTFSKDGKSETLEVDRALICIAMQPNSENLGLDKVGVQLDERGYVKVDQRMATNVPGIWAIGDVAATRYGLAHVASAEGHLAADAIAGHEVRPLNYNNMPRPVFCHPQLAFVGMTEAQAKEAGYEVKVGEFPFSALGKAVAENDFEGVVRLIVDAKYGEILGCHIIGPEATELLSQITPYKVLEGTSRELIDTVVSHPTLSESIKLAAALAEGESLEI